MMKLIEYILTIYNHEVHILGKVIWSPYFHLAIAELHHAGLITKNLLIIIQTQLGNDNSFCQYQIIYN